MSFVGFRRQNSLAEKIGCTEDQLSKWLSMEEPPVSMRKGFDVALFGSLRTDAFTLFTAFRDIAPEAAPVQGHPRKPTREPVAA